MSDWADNYDDLATTDDGSCDRLGCMSDWADNYDELATIDNGDFGGDGLGQISCDFNETIEMENNTFVTFSLDASSSIFFRLLATRANSAATKNAVAITITAINASPASVLIETPSETPILPHWRFFTQKSLSL